MDKNNILPEVSIITKLQIAQESLVRAASRSRSEVVREELFKFSHKVEVHVGELSKVFQIRFTEEIKKNLVVAEVASINLLQRANQRQLLVFCLKRVKDVLLAYEQAILICKGELRRFLLKNHKQDQEVLIINLRSLIKQAT